VLDIPSRERHRQKAADVHAPTSSADEVLDLAGFAIAGHQQAVPRPAILPQGHIHGFYLPHRWRTSLLLEAKRPRFALPHSGPRKHGLGAHRRLTSPRPTGERLRNFADVLHAGQIQYRQEPGLAAVPLVERQPVELPTVGLGLSHQFQADLPFRSVADLVRDIRRAAALAIGVPRLGQVQFAVEKRLELSVRDRQMNGDDPVVDFAHTAEVLPLHARRLVALLERTGLIKDGDGADRIGRQLGDRVAQAPLHLIDEAIVVPQARLEKLLQIAWRHAGMIGDRFGGLAWQIGKQATRVVLEVLNGLGVVKEPLQRPQKRGESWSQRLDLFHGHGYPSQGLEGNIVTAAEMSAAL
jgi:hypothetical protein